MQVELVLVYRLLLLQCMVVVFVLPSTTAKIITRILNALLSIHMQCNAIGLARTVMLIFRVPVHYRVAMFIRSTPVIGDST